jgi:hypothetical protein
MTKRTEKTKVANYVQRPKMGEKEQGYSIEFKVDNYTIRLNRVDKSSFQDEIKRLANYVYTICELGMQQKELLADKVAVTTESKGLNDTIQFNSVQRKDME